MKKYEMANDQQKQPNSLCCIPHAFHQTASSNPTKIALIQSTNHPKTPLNHTINTNIPLYNDDKFFTFSQLSSAINTLTLKLHQILNGVGPTKIVGVYMVPSVEYVVTVLAILRYGAVFLPLDPYWPKERILSVISSSNVDLIVGCSNSGLYVTAHLVNESHWLLNCCKISVLCICIDDIVVQKCGNFDLVWPCESGSLRKFSYLMYTSGSTGEPKGVCGTQEGVLNRFLWMQDLYPMNEDDVLLFKTSVSFVDHIQEVLAPMIVGCTLVVPPSDVLKGNFFGVVDFLDDYCISRMTAVPSLVRSLIPAIECRYREGVRCPLKLLVLSGEVFPISLWRIISRVLPETCILNIYGSTEVSGDCAYFDCRRLTELPEYEMLSSVPIGGPISNCDITLIVEDGKCDEGEICVKGVCVSSGYFSYGNIIPLDNVKLGEGSSSRDESCGIGLYHRTGDFAKRLPSGDLVFLGRKDRTIKVNGHRIALEEVEDTLRSHPRVADAAIVSDNEKDEHSFLGAVLVLKKNCGSSEILESIRSWMVDRVASVMIPQEIVCAEAIPTSATGKVDYTLLSSFFATVSSANDKHIEHSKVLEHIKEAFSKALGAVEVGSDDDFFALGGDSIAAAHVAHKLGIDMRLLYMFPSPSKLQKAVMEKKGIEFDQQIKWETLPEAQKKDLLFSSYSRNSDSVRSRKRGETIQTHRDDHNSSSKHVKVDTGQYSNTKGMIPISSFPWESYQVPTELSLGRCNKIMHNSKIMSKIFWPGTREVEIPRNSKGCLRKLWRVPMDSCVDASPVIAFKDGQMLIYIGSHSHKFVCVNAENGIVQWEMKLEGRIECSAVVDGDFSQVIVGCYQGKIYFVDMMKGIINWTFQTGGEVKSQPCVDKCRHIIWCGSHDHNLYCLDYKNHCCVGQFSCGGSIFGSPALDEASKILYAGTTNGRLMAIKLEASPFSLLWLVELKAPIFGSLSISSNGTVICCLVSGDVLAVNPKGHTVWRTEIDGPLFAGPCISEALDSQALVCSRNGNVYSLELERGSITWEYNVRDPISSSAYIDDSIKLVSDPSPSSERLVCVCSSSGQILLLLVNCSTAEAHRRKDLVKMFAEINLEGEIFSSPVMVGGRIFVGCRDDYLYCLVAEAYQDND